MPTLSTIALFLLAALGLLLKFVDPTRGTVIGQTLFLGILFVLLASCTDSLYALLGSLAGHLLTRSVRIRRVQRYVTGSIYIALGLTAAVTGSEKK